MSKNRELFLKHLAQTTPFPVGLEIDRAEGVFLYDTDGKRYLDLIGGVAVSNIGHRHPTVVAALQKQLDKHLHVMVYGEYIQEVQVQLAHRLAAVLPENLSMVYLVNSGTEANEGAIKLAKRYTGRYEVVGFHHSYHGSTHGSLSLTGNETKKGGYRPLLPGTRFISFNDETALSKITTATAAVIIEPVQGDAGVRIPAPNYLKALRDRCNATDTLLIMDEVQTGFGRTGKRFAFEHFDVVPDIITLAKGMGGGMPIGAFISAPEIMECLTHDPMLGHITTFGGHPMSCAAALANLDVLTDELIGQVAAKGNLFKELLQHPSVREIRGIGLMLALELKDYDQVSTLFHHCLENGVIGFWFLSSNNSFRIAPPLTIDEEAIKMACTVIREGLDLLK